MKMKMVMKKMVKRFQSFAAITIALLFTNSTSAQTYIAEWKTFGGFIDIRGGALNGAYPASAVNAEIELDAENRTVIFRRVKFEVPIEGKNFVLGFGERNVFIEGKITFEFTDDRSVQLRAGEGSQFLVSNNSWRSEISQWSQQRANVTYEFSGPNQRASGSFLFRNQWTRIYDPIIDMADYPNRVVVKNSPQWQISYDSTLIEETIDEANVSVRINYSFLAFPSEITFVQKNEITGIGLNEEGAMVISGTGTIGISDSAAGPFSGSIALPTIIHPDASAKFFKAN